MDDDAPTPNRRDFLTGRAARQQVEVVGSQMADVLVDAGGDRAVPVSHETVRLETTAMTCLWAVVMNPGPPRQVMVASDALDIVHAIEDQLTVYRPDSEVMHVNRHAAEDAVPVEPTLFALLQQCCRWSRSTGGAFDPTAGPLIQLWRKRRHEGKIPAATEIEDALRSVGIQQVMLNEERTSIQFPRAGYSLDFGAVGKGYAVDRAAAHLQQEGVTDFLLHGGHSSLYAAGDHASQGGWPVGIRNPLFTQQRLATVLLQNEGMATSGSNIQFYRHEGHRYGHILDPRTGRPTHSPEAVTREPDEAADQFGPPPTLPKDPRSGSQAAERAGPSRELAHSPQPTDALLSVTVLAPTAAEADALSTAFYVMGLENARNYCHNHPEIRAILIPAPAPARGRSLTPVVCNFPENRIFFE